MPAKKTTAKSARDRKPATKKPAVKSAAKTKSVAAKAPARPKVVNRKAAPPRSAAAKPAARTVAAAKPAAAKSAPAKSVPAKAGAQKAAAAPKPVPAAKPASPAKPAKPAVTAAAPATAIAAPVAAAKTPPAKPPVAPQPKRDPSKVATAVATGTTGTLPQSLPADEDDGEAPSRHNLLLGPRNVKPYVARKGEEYMNKEQTEHFRSILLTWKRDLMEEVDRTVTHMKDGAANPPDPNDRATLESEFALELRTRDRERKLIRKIEEALKRLEDGSYGYCMETGEPIGVKRLEARPVATLSIEAQERRERREKQYGDRDDWYR